MDESLYLAQQYKDAWEDYQRSLKNSSFPVWDYVVLTASNEHQAEGFRAQLEERKGFLPRKTKIAVIPDEGGMRIGSGGATLSVLKWLREREPSYQGLRVLVIHSGGDSKRIPQYSALGKLFSPIPHQLPDGRASTLFDEFMIGMSAIPGRIREGMLLLSGDVMLLFNPLLIDWNGKGAAVFSFKENVQTGKEHGVFLRGRDGYVGQFLQKQSEDVLRSVGAVNERGAVDIDTGAVVFGADVMESLWSLITDELNYRKFVNDKVRLSLYGDFLYPMAEDSSLEGFYREKPEGEFSEELAACREKVWETLRPYRMKLLRLAPAKIIHFGTTKEILELMTKGVENYRELGWEKRVNSSMDRAAGYNSILSPEAEVGEGTYLEVSYVHNQAKVGSHCVLSYVDVQDAEIPDHVVLHGLKQKNGKFVCRIFGVQDNPKDNKLFGRELSGELWDEGAPHNLWFANIFPECETIREAVSEALDLYKDVMKGKIVANGKSMASGFRDADPDSLLSWNRHMAELVQMDQIADEIDNHAPVKEKILTAPLSKIQLEWLENQIRNSDYSREMRLHYYVGSALGDESEVTKTFSTLSSAILKKTLMGLSENERARIQFDEHEIELPLRVNWGGGWSDTPPYCNENGGTVLNAAVLLNGERPVRVTLRRLQEKKIVFESRDMNVYGEFDRIEPLQSVGDPYDPFVLQKAALLACGVIPATGGDLKTVLDRLGGGFLLDTEVTGVPKGSGLGTSSILAAGCVKALFEFLGIEHKEDDLYSHVLCMEQIMSTGGGWQDQVGGVTDGIKFITSKPGLKQGITVRHIDCPVMEELNERFCLIYTGQRRLARNLLRDVVGRYIGNEPETVYAMNEIQRVAALMRFELEKGHIDEFATLLNKHWELSQMIDAGSTNTLIDQIFATVEDLLAGKMICGAGGGGFLQVVLKKDVSKAALAERLQSVYQDTEIRMWDCTLV